MACKFNISSEDVVQEFFLALLEGNNTRIEWIAYGIVQTEYRKGIVGHRNLKDFNFHPMESLKAVRLQAKESTDIEFREYMIDMLRPLSEVERKFFLMAIKGYTRHEIMEDIRKSFPISNENFYKMAKEIDYSRWEYSYKQDGRVYR